MQKVSTFDILQMYKISCCLGFKGFKGWGFLCSIPSAVYKEISSDMAV